jgi:hypothetical protein
LSYRNQPRGPDGRWVKSGGGLLAVLALAAALSAGPGGAATSAAASGGSTAARSSSGGSSQVRATARDVGRVVDRLQRLEKRVDQITSETDDDCAAHATGQVRAFLVEHPCTALVRALFEVRDGRTPVLRVAVAYVDMPDAELARQYQRLIDRDGTGTVRPLNRTGRGDDPHFDGIAYASTSEGSTVVIAQAAPVGRVRRAEALAEEAVELAASA